MALLNILVYPVPRLRQRAAPVDSVDDSVRKIIDDMAQTMYAAPGIGLAATQVNIHRRIIVTDVSQEKNDLRALINPTIRDQFGETETEEGCLSLPGITLPVMRSESVTVHAQDQYGNSFEMVADGILAVCIQHEIDHLDGKVMVDYLSRLKRDRLRKRILREQREGSITAVEETATVS